jgi:hypothetical protein
MVVEELDDHQASCVFRLRLFVSVRRGARVGWLCVGSGGCLEWFDADVPWRELLLDRPTSPTLASRDDLDRAASASCRQLAYARRLRLEERRVYMLELVLRALCRSSTSLRLMGSSIRLSPRAAIDPAADRGRVPAPRGRQRSVHHHALAAVTPGGKRVTRHFASSTIRRTGRLLAPSIPVSSKLRGRKHQRAAEPRPPPVSPSAGWRSSHSPGQQRFSPFRKPVRQRLLGRLRPVVFQREHLHARLSSSLRQDGVACVRGV